MKTATVISIGLISLGLLAAGCSRPQENGEADFRELVDAIGKAELRHSPEQAYALRIPTETFGGRYDDLLDDRSIAVTERMRLNHLAYLKLLEAIDRANLSPASVRLLDSVTFAIDAGVRMDRYPYGYTQLGWASPYLINQSDGAYTDLVKLLTTRHAIFSRADAEAWLARLKKVDEAIIDERRQFEVDMANGGVPPRAILQRTLDKARSLRPVDARSSALILYFAERLSQLADLPVADMTRMIDEAVVVVEKDIDPAYVDLIATLETAIKDAPQEPGVWRLKDGEAYYRDALRLFTTTDLSPDQIRDVGLALVDELTKEMDAILVSLGRVEGSVGQRMQLLAADALYLYPETPEGHAAMTAALEQQMKWADTKLSSLVSVGPKAKVEIREVPAIAYDSASGAYYKPATLDGMKAAMFTIKLRSMQDWPTWTLPTLTYHETAPGHHLQASLAREQPGQPVLSYLIATPAFSEGWALYAEDLAAELGAYEQDQLGRLGYLQSLLFRAARMVADTGLHSERWSRERAIDYMTSVTGMARAQMENEVDRYIIWPGQACAYMVGREKIRNLREEADVELGQTFDLKTFHDAVLTGGGRPLGVLEIDIQNWIQSRRAPAPAEVAQN
jgi:uncharacterized protein (DUF885 family)